jgi:dihydroxyacetone kinase-like predicted kinase
MTGGDVQAMTKELAAHMLSKGGEFAGLYYGEGVTADMAEELGAYIASEFPAFETEVYDGKQPLYYYILSVE